MTAYAWNFFKQLDESRNAKCTICFQLTKVKDLSGNITTGGLNHPLESHHKITWNWAKWAKNSRYSCTKKLRGRFFSIYRGKKK